MTFPKLCLGPIFAFFTGRHTFFALFFAVTAFILAWNRKLDSNYAAVIVAVNAYVLAHSIKEDHYANGKDNGGS